MHVIRDKLHIKEELKKGDFDNICVYVCVCMCLHASVYLSICPSFFLSLCLSVCLSVSVCIQDMTADQVKEELKKVKMNASVSAAASGGSRVWYVCWGFPYVCYIIILSVYCRVLQSVAVCCSVLQGVSQRCSVGRVPCMVFLQKRPIILRSLLIVATPYIWP